MMGGMGIFEFPAMIEPDGSLGNLIVAVVGVLITMVLVFGMTMIFYKEDAPVTQTEKSGAKAADDKAAETEKHNQSGNDARLMNRMEIASPIKGTVIRQGDMKDAAFGSGALGIGITTDLGVELLIHVGLDTVQLNGEGFRAYAAEGDRVARGQLLLEFDQAFIESKGYCMETPVLVTNADDYLDVVETSAAQVNCGDELLRILN